MEIAVFPLGTNHVYPMLMSRTGQEHSQFQRYFDIFTKRLFVILKTQEYFKNTIVAIILSLVEEIMERQKRPPSVVP